MSSGSRSKGLRPAKYSLGRTVRRIFPYLLISVPVFFSLLYVRAFGVNVVVRDQWEVATLFGELSSGTLSLADLWEPHNEHRFFFPRMAMLALGSVTQWNTVAEMYLIQVCLIATLIVLFFAFRNTVGHKAILFVPIAFLVFSLRQRTNLLWGYQITFAMTLAFTVLALFLLYASGNGRRGSLAFFAAVLCAAVATGSSIQGLLVWPAGLVQLLLLFGRERSSKVMLALWGSVGSAAWIFYFLGYERRGESPGSPISLLAAPFSGAEYFLTILGNSLTSRQGAVVLAGALLLALIVIALLLVFKSGISGMPDGYAFWISLLAFSLLVLMTITVGRIELDTQSALASRYTTFSLLTVTSLYAIFTRLLKHRPQLATVVSLSLLLTMISPSAALSYKNAIQLGIQEKNANVKAAATLRGYESRSNRQLEILHGRPETVRRGAPILERLDYSVFAANGR